MTWRNLRCSIEKIMALALLWKSSKKKDKQHSINNSLPHTYHCISFIKKEQGKIPIFWPHFLCSFSSVYQMLGICWQSSETRNRKKGKVNIQRQSHGNQRHKGLQTMWVRKTAGGFTGMPLIPSWLGQHRNAKGGTEGREWEVSKTEKSHKNVDSNMEKISGIEQPQKLQWCLQEILSIQIDYNW